MSLSEVDVTRLWQALADADADHHAGLRDWLGNRWEPGSFPALPVAPWKGPDLPHEGDGFRAGPLEWAGLALAAAYAHKDERDPTLVEMGASQAPWCLSWVRAMQKLGAPAGRSIRATAFEGAAGTDAAARFWEQQGLDASIERREDGLDLTGPGWKVEWRRRAVLQGGGEARFPDVDIAQDNGAQAVRTSSDRDYRGHPVRHQVVPAVDPVEVVEALGFVHFLHLDIQGGEEEVLQARAFDSMRDRIGVVMLGTHSRAAEALAFETLPEAGFVLVDEEPCLYSVSGGVPHLVRDGEQLWLAPVVVEFLQVQGLLQERGLLDLSRRRRQETAGRARPAPALPAQPPRLLVQAGTRALTRLRSVRG